MKYFLGLIIVLFSLSLSFGQTKETNKDSLKKSVQIGLMGQWQKGNLEQFSIMPNAVFKLYNNSFYTEVGASYNYLLLGEFNPVNDLWVRGLFQYKQNKRIYPSFHSINGFAKSYKIDGSYFSSVGAGLNLIENSPRKHLQFHLTAGYLYFKFADEFAHSTLGFGTSIRGLFPLSKQVKLTWLLSSYQSGQEIDFFGGGNQLKLDIMLSKRLFMNVIHQIYYHNKEIPNTEKTTSIMQFGISYKY